MTSSTGGEFSDRVHRASRIISKQLGCDTDEALGRLLIRAEAAGQGVERVAIDVIDGMIRFSH